MDNTWFTSDLPFCCVAWGLEDLTHLSGVESYCQSHRQALQTWHWYHNLGDGVFYCFVSSCAK